MASRKIVHKRLHKNSSARYGFCYLSVIPVRKEADHESEMVTQLLFGDVAEIIGQKKYWAKIRTPLFNQGGYVVNGQLLPITKSQAGDFEKNFYSLKNPLAILDTKNGKAFLPAGSRLPKSLVHQSDSETFQFTIDNISFSLQKEDVFTEPILLSEIPWYGKKFLYAPYQWGGKTVLGFDCSGFTQLMYRQAGISLIHSARKQSKQGKKISFSEIKTSDLVFFKDEKGEIIHVGIAMGNGKIIHASEKVRIDTLTEKGIWNEELKKYSHFYHSAVTFQ